MAEAAVDEPARADSGDGREVEADEAAVVAAVKGEKGVNGAEGASTESTEMNGNAKAPDDNNGSDWA